MAWRVSCALSCMTEACAKPARPSISTPANAAAKMVIRPVSALAVAIVKAAAETHSGMATFAEAGVSDKD